ncbi:MAG TPA: glycosyltransferase family 2 protein [Candidatus Binataceae bacterium]
MPPTISLIVITKNEEALIGQCLRSASFCDELIVVDSFSSDRTAAIARDRGAKVFQHAFDGYISQKQYALERATCDWVLSLDADEQATYDLGQEITRAAGSGAPVQGYEIRRILYHLDHYFTRGSFPDWHLRLFSREMARFGGREPHAKAIVNGRTARLKSPILHFSYDSVADHVATMNRLTDQAALEAQPTAMVAFKMIADPLWRFLNFYILRGGFRDGTRGLYAATASAFYAFLKYAKLYERRLRVRRAL